MKKILFIITFIFFLTLSFTNVFAEEKVDLGTGLSTCPKDSVCLDNPLGEGTTVQTLIGKVIKSVLGVVGSLALLMFIYGGFTWMTAAGASDKVTKGRDTLVWAVIGLVVVFSAYAMVKFVFTSLAL